MTERFPVGSKAYTKDGHPYIVEEVAGGMVYCSLTNGTETDFPEDTLFNEQEWMGRSGGQDEVIYGRIKRAKAYVAVTTKLNRTASGKILMRAEGLSPGILDFAAYTISVQSLSESGHDEHLDGLSIVKCRDVFDSHSPEIQASALASVLGSPAGVFVSIADLGDNLLRAMIDKGMAGHAAAFDEFCDRPRR
ncbi:MAG: hypothetical protein OSB02_11975 [Rhodospirillaceae bacterium]|nr:hypothetical protein [Rhodospirillaceae bacterium]